MMGRDVKQSKGPEEKIVDGLTALLRKNDWTVMRTHGNLYQQGFPDLYALHHKYGARWIEVKVPVKHAFTAAQRKFFPIIAAAGVGIWVITGFTLEDYKKLFQSPNWYMYLYERVYATPTEAKDWVVSGGLTTSVTDPAPNEWAVSAGLEAKESTVAGSK